MGRKAEWPPKAHRHKATGQSRVRWLGREYYLGPWGTPAARKEYVRLITQLERSAREADAPPPKVITLACVAAGWRAHAEREYGDTYERELIDGVLARLLALWPAMPAAEFRAKKLEEFRDHLIAHSLCRNVVNKHVIRLRTVWRWAEGEGLVPDGSWGHLRTLKPLVKGRRGTRETEQVRPAEWPDLAAVCRRCGRSVRSLLLVQWYTGARPGELFDLRVGEVQRGRGDHYANRAKHKNAWRGHTRTLRFGRCAMRVLTPLLEGGADDLVFPNRLGNAFTRTSYYTCVSRAARAAGVTLHPYQIRHAAKRRFTRELGLDAARAMLGQASIMTTDKYAAGGDEKLAAEVARRCG